MIFSPSPPERGEGYRSQAACCLAEAGRGVNPIVQIPTLAKITTASTSISTAFCRSPFFTHSATPPRTSANTASMLIAGAEAAIAWATPPNVP